MEELIKTFHIEINLLVAQFVNFAIILFVLWKFAYKPILKTLNDRTKKIEKGVKDAEEAGKKLKETAEKEKEILIKARKEAQDIIKKSETDAKKNAQSIMEQAKEQNEKMIADTKKMIEQEKTRMLADVKADVADLVVSATEKIIAQKLDASKDKELIEASIK